MNKLELYKQAIQIRKRFGESDTSPIDIFAVAQNIPHLTIVLYPMGTNISGMCVRVNKDAIIAINSTMSIGRQNFTLAHELYHYYFDESQLLAICKKDIGVGDEIEQAADQFAAYMLMPLGDDVNIDDEITFEKVIELSQYYKVSNQAMLYRLYCEEKITSKQCEQYKYHVANKAMEMGYDISLYRPSQPEKQSRSFGYYIKQAQKANDSELISNGKYEQLLLEAFRDDIVFGTDSQEEDLDD